ncbi:Ligand-binding domain of nuclear hormone receptor [Dictyocaulus viviparus]|uniref:Ligand-binding domain of nuclear hormone receptor n=1 Tax=Dictyocaulus viviparus TaxID=29172 RepID=A0A0D8Y9X0_DICVI|nr:Ligand-binding domain of nuclear hormone receptor [Dictyocaulus viviparus]
MNNDSTKQYYSVTATFKNSLRKLEWDDMEVKIDDQRNTCRSCRLQKCIEAGMKSNAIQNERDTIGKRKKPENEADELLVELLMSEKLCQQLRSSVIKSTEQVSYDCGKVKTWRIEDDRWATLNDVGKSIHQQLVLLVEWAKSLPQFAGLTLDDQAMTFIILYTEFLFTLLYRIREKIKLTTALLKATAAQIIILGVAFRSLSFENSICLANDTLIPKEHAANIGDINCVVGRIIDELVTPMRRLSIDLCEYVALKAILFFNPVAKDVADSTTVENARIAFLRAIEKRCQQYSMEISECRAGRLLLLLPSLQAVAQQMVEDVQLARLFGFANVDSLMEELILHDERAYGDVRQSLASPCQMTETIT